ncbi:hypothetical protein RCL1_009090 [Eukaryota sp. TZLM3-RCL]
MNSLTRSELFCPTLVPAESTLACRNAHSPRATTQSKFLGHVFFKKTRSIDSSRISALVELPPPKNVKEVRSFVGSVNYLRDWLPQISEELAPIIELTRGSESGNRAPPIKWTHDHQLRFERIKRMIIDHVPLSLPDKDSKILISTDASDLAVGGVIWQEMPPCAPCRYPLIDRKVTLSRSSAGSSKTHKRIGAPYRKNCTRSY